MIAEPETMTITEVIRQNLRRLRNRGRWVIEEEGHPPKGRWLSESRRQVAERIRAWTGDNSWDEWRIYDIEGRKGRDRSISAEELSVLAITYDTSVLDLMTPPPDVRVKVGGDTLSPPVFDRVLGTPTEAPALEDELMRRLVLQRGFRGEATKEDLMNAGMPEWIAETVVRHDQWRASRQPLRSRSLIGRPLTPAEWEDQLSAAESELQDHYPTIYVAQGTYTRKGDEEE